MSAVRNKFSPEFRDWRCGWLPVRSGSRCGVKGHSRQVHRGEANAPWG